MLLSVREVFQLADRCFRASGFEAGTARAVAESIWWTEAYRGTGLATLHRLLEDLSDMDRSRISLRSHNDMTVVLDNGDQPGLLASTPLRDLCCSLAEQQGIGLAFSPLGAGDRTLATLGHAAYRGAERGYLPVVMHTDHEGNSRTIVGMPDDPHPFLAERRLETPSVSYAKLAHVLDSGVHQRHNSPLTQAVFTDHRADEYGRADERLLNRFLAESVDPRPEGAGQALPGVVMLCIEPTHPSHSDRIRTTFERFLTDRSDSFSEVFRPTEIQNRVGQRLQEGIEVEEARWRDLFEVSSGILAPPFEGSYQGAGFDINE